MSKPAPRVSEYMTRMPHTIQRSQPLTAAHRLMRNHGIRHLPVLDGERLVGVVSLDDLHLIESLDDVDPSTVLVEEAMSEEPYTVAPDTPLDQVAAVMAERKIGSALVVNRDEVIGMFTTVDALDALLMLLRSDRDEQPSA